MEKKSNSLLNKLQYHVSGAVERGEKTAIEAIVAPKHTPGPWVLEDHGSAQLFVCTFTDDGDTIDTTLYYKDSQITDEDRANARLIAAAPELLAALKRQTELLNKLANGKWDGIYCDEQYDILEASERLLKKFEGGADD